jgi:hypothetical protein
MRPCFLCKHYRPLEDKLGVCALFHDIKNARYSSLLCGPIGKWFELKRSDLKPQ